VQIQSGSGKTGYDVNTNISGVEISDLKGAKK
jgi:hypothetical protein